MYIIYYYIILYVFIFPSCLCQRSRSILRYMDRDWTASFQIRFRNGTCINILDKKYNIGNSSSHFGSYNRLLDYYKIISISRPHIGTRLRLRPIWVSLFQMSEVCNKQFNTQAFHIGLVIIHRPILALDCVSGQYGGLGMITRPIWKCPCINL